MRARARLLSAATGVCVARPAWAATAEAAGLGARYLCGVHAGHVAFAAVVARAQRGGGSLAAAVR